MNIYDYPQVSNIRVADAWQYLITNGWKWVGHNTHFHDFEKFSLDDFVEVQLLKHTDYRDSRHRMAEFVEDLAKREHKTFFEMMNTLLNFNKDPINITKDYLVSDLFAILRSWTDGYK